MLKYVKQTLLLLAVVVAGGVGARLSLSSSTSGETKPDPVFAALVKKHNEQSREVLNRSGYSEEYFTLARAITKEQNEYHDKKREEDMRAAKEQRKGKPVVREKSQSQKDAEDAAKRKQEERAKELDRKKKQEEEQRKQDVERRAKEEAERTEKNAEEAESRRRNEPVPVTTYQRFSDDGGLEPVTRFITRGQYEDMLSSHHS